MTRPPDPPDFDPEQPQQPGLPIDPPVEEVTSRPLPAPRAPGVPPPPPWPPSVPPPPDASLPSLTDGAPRGAPVSRADEPPSEPSPPVAGPTPPPLLGRGDGRSDRPFAPVISDDDGRSVVPPTFAEYDDSGVLRVLGVIVLLAIVIAVLVLPPLSILDRGGEDSGGLSVQAQDQLPVLPGGLVAVSQLYNLKTEPELTEQSLWTLTIKLSETTDDDRNLAFYTHREGDWIRLSSASLTEGGAEAQAEVSEIPDNIAVLRRVAFERTLGLIVEAGESPDPEALAASPIVAVAAGTLGIGDDGTAALSALPDAVDLASAGGSTVYLGVTVDPSAEAALDQLLSTEPATVAHVGELVAAVQDVNADGLYLAYLNLDRTRQAAFTRLVSQLSIQLAAEGLGLVVGVPVPATADTGAYDWAALTATTGGLWLNAPADPSTYYEQLAVVLDAQQAAGVELDSVSLVIGRRSHIRDSAGVTEIGAHEALGRAAQLEAGVEGGIAVGDLVSLTAVNLVQDLGNSGLRWDTPSRTVSFVFSERGTPRTVWVENRFSIAFRLDLAQQYDLGGVVIADAQADHTLPGVWDALAAYLDSGVVTLEQPYGPYLAPCWQAPDGVIEGEAGNCWAGGDTSGVATWRAPAKQGVYRVRLVVSDGEVFVGRELALRVTEQGEQSDPTPEPTEAAGPEPTAEPTTEAAADPAPPAPTEEPATQPTEEPTSAPTEQPTAEPTAASTPEATATQGPPGPGGNE